MENDSNAAVPVRSEDKRASELEDLRRRNLAKTMQGQLDGKGQPITKESWYQQQKEQSEQMKKQQLAAAENLHKFRNENVVASNEVKQELKKKELEATTMLHNYRGSTDAISSHQVKKISTASMFQTGGFPVSTPPTKAEMEKAPKLQNEDNVDDFLASLDDQFLPSPTEKMSTAESNKPLENATMKIDDDGDGLGELVEKPSESSNENSNESTEWVVLTEEEKARTISDDFMKINHVATNAKEEVPLPQSIESPVPQSSVHEVEFDASPSEDLALEPPAQPTETTVPLSSAMPELSKKSVLEPPTSQLSSPQPPAESEWSSQLVSISFGLLTDDHNAPPTGTVGNSPLLNEMESKMRNSVSVSLQGYDQHNDVKLLDQCFDIFISRDENYVAPQERPFITKSFVRMVIHLDIRDKSITSTVETLIRNCLKNKLDSIYP